MRDNVIMAFGSIVEAVVNLLEFSNLALDNVEYGNLMVVS